MSEGRPIERWRNTCVAISSRQQETAVWPKQKYLSRISSPPSSSETTTKLLCIYRTARHLSRFPLFVLFAANIFCLFLRRRNSRFLSRGGNFIKRFIPALIDNYQQLEHKKCQIYKAAKTYVKYIIVVGPLPRVRPRNGILALLLLVVLVPLRSEFISEL